MKRIVIKVNLQSDKSRSKALKIAAVSQGVSSVALEGESRDQVVVTGDGVDSVCLANQMRKKFGYATLLSVEDVTEASNENGGGGEQQNGTAYSIAYYGNYPPACPTYYHVVLDPYPNSTCSIL